jgi:proline dehydrogenase
MTPSQSNDRAEAADTLRAWALDENLKSIVMGTPALASAARRIARRYTGGDTIADALVAANASVARGPSVSVEYAGLPSTVSIDLSHVGSVVDPGLGLGNARCWGSDLGCSMRCTATASEPANT